MLFLLCVKFQLFPGFPTNLKNHHFREKYDELCPNGGPVNMKSEFQIFFHTVTETQTLLTQRLNLAKFEKPQCGNFMIFLSLRFYLREINVGDARIAKSAISTHSEALKLDFYKFLHFLKAEIYQIDKIQSP